MFGVAVFLVAASMIFLGLFTAFIIYRFALPVWPPEGTPELELLLPGVNTIILVSSSFVIHLGDAAIKRNKVWQMRFWYVVTAIMGATFLAGQIYEYMHLGYGLTTNVFSNCFYILTGLGFSCIPEVFASLSSA